MVPGQGVAAVQLLPSSRAWFPAGPATDHVCFLQAGYEVAPDEKRKECGQHLIEKYLKPKVSERAVYAACSSRTADSCHYPCPVAVLDRITRAKSTSQVPVLFFPIILKQMSTCVLFLWLLLPDRTHGHCPALTQSLCPQSEDYVPEVPSQLVDACCERLEQEPSKELFKESTK